MDPMHGMEIGDDNYKDVIARLEKFIRTFVAEFTSRLDDYDIEIQPGHQTEKSGKLANAVAKSSGLMSAIPVAGKAVGAGLSFIVTLIGRRIHRNTAKATTAAATNGVFEKEVLRKMAAEAGFLLFGHFENQFVRITDVDGRWDRGIGKLALDAADRALNYIKLSKGGTRMTSGFLTEGVILGTSKQGLWKTLCTKRVQELVGMAQGGHSLKVSDIPWNTSSLYRKTGLILVEDGDPQYYRWTDNPRKSGKDKYGYRHPFQWELDRWNRGLKLNYKKWDIGSSGHQDIIGVVSSLHQEEILRGILEDIDKEDQLKTVCRIVDKVDGLETNLTGFRAEVQQHYDKQQSIILNWAPLWYKVRKVVVPYIDRTALMNRVAKEVVKECVVVVCGQGGIGKSELVLSFARQEYCDRDSVIWIKADSPEMAKDWFRKLHFKLGLGSKDDYGSEKTVGAIIGEVYSYFTNPGSFGRRCLFVFDDVDSFDAVKEFLPLQLPPDARRPDLLITSRRTSGWPLDRGAFSMVEVSGFTVDEAASFIKCSLGIKYDNKATDAEILKLAEKHHQSLRNLKMAVAYILNEKENGGYELAMKNYLDSNLRGDKTTLQMTLNKIRENGESGDPAIEMLYIISYLASSDIPDTIFLDHWAHKERFESIMGLLEQLEVLDWKGGLINAHAKDQDSMRLELKDKSDEWGQSLEENTLEVALQLLSGDLQSKSVTLTPHVVSAWSYACKYENLIKTFIIDDIYDKPRHTSFFHLLCGSSGGAEVVGKVLEIIKREHFQRLDLVVNVIDELKATPMHYAAECGNLAIVNLLIANKAEINKMDRLRFRPLHFAAKHGHLDVVQVLLDKGPKGDINSKTGRAYRFSAAHLAAQNGNVDILRCLLDSGAQVECKTRYGFTPLHVCAQSGHTRCAKILLDYGADVEAVSEEKCTPLMLATKKRHSRMVVRLLASGADVNCRNAFHYSPLHYAVLNGDVETVCELLRNKFVNVDAKTAESKTPLDFANERNDLDVVKAFARKLRSLP